jgi:hypothetical protein
MNKSIVFCLGRMNPPTIGHQRLIEKVLEVAMDTESDHVIYLSQTVDKDNPLGWEFKHKALEATFPGINISDDLSVKNPYIALEKLKDNYTNIVLVAGSDQVSDYTKFIKYTDEWGVKLSIISAGARDGKQLHESISATKLRQYARDGNRLEFIKGLPTTMPVGVRNLVYKNTQKSLKLSNKVRKCCTAR